MADESYHARPWTRALTAEIGTAVLKLKHYEDWTKPEPEQSSLAAPKEGVGKARSRKRARGAQLASRAVRFASEAAVICSSVAESAGAAEPPLVETRGHSTSYTRGLRELMSSAGSFVSRMLLSSTSSAPPLLPTTHAHLLAFAPGVTNGAGTSSPLRSVDVVRGPPLMPRQSTPAFNPDLGHSAGHVLSVAQRRVQASAYVAGTVLAYGQDGQGKRGAPPKRLLPPVHGAAQKVKPGVGGEGGDKGQERAAVSRLRAPPTLYGALSEAVLAELDLHGMKEGGGGRVIPVHAHVSAHPISPPNGYDDPPSPLPQLWSNSPQEGEEGEDEEGEDLRPAPLRPSARGRSLSPRPTAWTQALGPILPAEDLATGARVHAVQTAQCCPAQRTLHMT